MRIMVRIRHFRGGVHPPSNKNTKDSPTRRLDAFETVRIPMSMHIGKPCTCLVKAGDEVLAGQKIGDSDALMSVPIHSSVSGKVTAIKNMVLSTGAIGEVVEIESDSLYRRHGSVTPPLITDRESFLRSIRESGLVGLGGASFPTHVKLPASGRAGTGYPFDKRRRMRALYHFGLSSMHGTSRRNHRGRHRGDAMASDSLRHYRDRR